MKKKIDIKQIRGGGMSDLYPIPILIILYIVAFYKNKISIQCALAELKKKFTGFNLDLAVYIIGRNSNYMSLLMQYFFHNKNSSTSMILIKLISSFIENKKSTNDALIPFDNFDMTYSTELKKSRSKSASTSKSKSAPKLNSKTRAKNSNLKSKSTRSNRWRNVAHQIWKKND